MMNKANFFVCLFSCFAIFSCKEKETYFKGSFGYDLDFLKKYKDVVVLKDDLGKSQIAIVGDYQARVMTSTSDGEKGYSYGWINYDLISSKKLQKHINAFGGENRFWMGPEGGQYSLFFEKGKDFTLKNWQTPSPIDTEKFNMVHQSNNEVHFTKNMSLKNYSDYVFEIKVDRHITLLDKENILDDLHLNIDSKVSYVAYATLDKITNVGDKQWKKETGLISIWVLGMFIPSDETMVVIPYKNKDSLQINTKYFGDIGPDRLSVRDNVVLFKGDGKYRSKIGLPPKNIIPIIASYDHMNNILTVVRYSFDDKNEIYVNSLWEHHKYPYRGDVVNSYNDGPTEDGNIIGPFYELESSSPAFELKPNENFKHKHTTYHFKGEREELNKITQKLLGVNIKDIRIP